MAINIYLQKPGFGRLNTSSEEGVVMRPTSTCLFPDDTGGKEKGQGKEIGVSHPEAVNDDSGNGNIYRYSVIISFASSGI